MNRTFSDLCDTDYPTVGLFHGGAYSYESVATDESRLIQLVLSANPADRIEAAKGLRGLPMPSDEICHFITRL